LSSDKALCERIARVCTEDLGLPITNELMIRSGGSEDIAYMMNRVQEQGGQAVFMRTRTPLAAGAHNRRFDFDEANLATVVKIFCGTVYDILK
jgi:aminobenzoyl-glutamate utilization protein A